MAKTKAVTKYRKSRRSNNGGRKIPLAVIAGLAPGVIWGVDSAAQGNWQGMFERWLAAYTGYEWGYKKFSFFYLNKGLYPLLAGMLAHAAANWTGLNRLIGKARLPIEL